MENEIEKQQVVTKAIKHNISNINNLAETLQEKFIIGSQRIPLLENFYYSATINHIKENNLKYSFKTLWEQLSLCTLSGGYGAIEHRNVDQYVNSKMSLFFIKKATIYDNYYIFETTEGEKYYDTITRFDQY